MMVDCPHLQDAVKTACLNIALEPPWSCIECGNTNYPWMCLYCGHVRCGRYANAHAMEHFKSECTHNVLFDCHGYSVYCYACDDYVTNDHTSRTIGLLRKKLQQLNEEGERNGQRALQSAASSNNLSNLEAFSTSCELVGLRNLGNTCFMNAVLQALNAVGPLRSYLLSLPPFDGPTCAFAWLCRLPIRSAPAALPDVVADAVLSAAEQPLPLPSPPADAGRVTRNAARLMREHRALLQGLHDFDDPACNQDTSDNRLLCQELRLVFDALARFGVRRKSPKATPDPNEPVSPDGLLQVVWKAVPRFRGYQQQDAHEFMHYLLDHLHSELCLAQYFHHRSRCSTAPFSRSSSRLADRNAQEPLTSGSLVANAATLSEAVIERGASNACRCGWLGERASAVTAAFGGVLHSEVACLQCGMVSITPEPFLDLQLDIPARFSKTPLAGRMRTRNTLSSSFLLSTPTHTNAPLGAAGSAPAAADEEASLSSVETRSADSAAPVSKSTPGVCTLHDCLESFTAVERLSETELYRCPSCQCRQPSTKRFWLKRLPPVLCLQLKRFCWQNTFGSAPQDRVKLDTFVEFPLRALDLRRYVVPCCAQDLHCAHTSNNPFEYDLVAAIVHHGSGSGSGHYTSFARHGSTWYHFNDTLVTPVSEDVVRKARAYILLYAQHDFRIPAKSAASKSPSPQRNANDVARTSNASGDSAKRTRSRTATPSETVGNKKVKHELPSSGQSDTPTQSVESRSKANVSLSSVKCEKVTSPKDAACNSHAKTAVANRTKLATPQHCSSKATKTCLPRATKQPAKSSSANSKKTT